MSCLQVSDMGENLDLSGGRIPTTLLSFLPRFVAVLAIEHILLGYLQSYLQDIGGGVIMMLKDQHLI